eukprot:gene4057-16168_t
MQRSADRRRDLWELRQSGAISADEFASCKDRMRRPAPPPAA